MHFHAGYSGRMHNSTATTSTADVTRSLHVRSQQGRSQSSSRGPAGSHTNRAGSGFGHSHVLVLDKKNISKTFLRYVDHDKTLLINMVRRL